MAFTTSYASILQQIATIDPIAYGRTRNAGNGAVTRLSPYISRGVISTRKVYLALKVQGYQLQQMEQLVKELCWRDYFQRIGQLHTQELIQNEARPQINVRHYQIPEAVLQAHTGIEAIDQGIQELYKTGYVHNHLRMYIASITTNIAGAHWLLPARWLYYYLLDADFASNACSWQWVCGVRSTKRYYANQENINRYFNTSQSGTFLDRPYEDFSQMQVPDVLKAILPFKPHTLLPETPAPSFLPDLPVYIYNGYNLDPEWHTGQAGNRILLLEPDHFLNFPIHPRTLEFIVELAQQIPDIQIYTGSFQSLQQYAGNRKIIFKEHPLFRHYSGEMEPRDWIVPEVQGTFPSFFAYWKKVQPYLI